MKSLLYAAIITLGIAACTQPAINYNEFAEKYQPYNNRGAQIHSQTGAAYVATPGAALQKQPASSTDAAFDQYANNDHGVQPAYTNPNIINPPPINPYQGNNLAPQLPVMNNGNYGSLATNNGGYAAPSVTPAENRVVLPPISGSSTQLLQQPSSDENHGPMDYIVKISNGTNGRIFVEAHDANNTIYPCGFMQKGQSFSTPLKNVMPVKGPIVVVVRDPDQANAPELRRYRITPPRASYKSRTLGIKLIAGGRYEASIDGKVYFENDPNL